VPFFAEKLNLNRAEPDWRLTEQMRFRQQDSDEKTDSASLRMTAELLFATQRNDDFFVTAAENYAAVFDSLNCHLINLGANLETELLAF
jgi:hypothetical protein